MILKNKWGLNLAVQLFGDLRHVPALVAGLSQFVFRRLARTIGVGQATGAIGRTSARLGYITDLRAGIRQADNHTAMMQQRDLGAENSRFVTATHSG